MSRKLRVFLCHASEDKPIVRELYKRLAAETWIDPWLDEEKLLPGQDWEYEIEKALDNSDAVIVTLSTGSVSKEGYVQKELRFALNIALEKPEGTIFILPVRLDDCERPRRLRAIQGIDYFMPISHERLIKSLEVRAESLKIEINESKIRSGVSKEKSANVDFDLYSFIHIPSTEELPYSFYIGKYPVTNAQYERFLNAPDFTEKTLWVNFPKYNEDCVLEGRWGNEGWDWLQNETKESGNHLQPRYWQDENFGISNPDNPVVGITWYESSAYCNWLMKHWDELNESRINSGWRAKQTRLPLDFEWKAAAGGDKPKNRYPWDPAGKVTSDEKEIVRRANVANIVGHTTRVNAYPRGASPFGVLDMSGNVWEWQGNFQNMKEGWLSLRGGSWFTDADGTHINWQERFPPFRWYHFIGFRVAVFPSR